MTEIIFERKAADDEIVEIARKILESGGIAILPTDTIPGIGCRADDHDAVVRLFELKNRPHNLPLPVIIADAEDVRRYARELPPQYHALAKKYWPGALTIVLKSNGRIDKLVGGGKDTIGFRVPDYPLIRQIVRKIKGPLALTSANPHTLIPSAMHERLLAWWNHEVELIVLGRSTVTRPASAVVDLVSDPPCILREGIISTEELDALISRQ
jgi:tRNA threonylcarbamoyl adenosine modification protein (Sua5/YciO/YrdC/YwlC family)